MALLLLTACAAAPEAFGQKTKRAKDKRFEPVVRQNLRDYEGRYVGIEQPEYSIEVRVAADGRLRITNLEDGRAITLTNVKVTGAHVTADKTYFDGRKGTFDVTFGNRFLYGQGAFGLLVDCLEVRLDGGIVLNKLFYRRS
jgi:hypothetical protein